MTKKGGQIQLQVELNTDEEWTKFIDREGLIGKIILIQNPSLSRKKIR